MKVRQLLKEEARRMLDLDNDSMLGIFNKYNDENESIKEKEHIDEVDKLESTSNHIGKKELVSVVENTNHENPYIQRFCVIEPEDSFWKFQNRLKTIIMHKFHFQCL